MSEELDLGHVLSERGAVEIDERADAPRQAVNGARNELLSGSRLADDAQRRITHRGALHDREDDAHRRVLRDNLRRGVNAREPGVEVLILLGELAFLPGAPDEYVDLRHAVRLRHIVVGTEL